MSGPDLTLRDLEARLVAAGGSRVRISMHSRGEWHAIADTRRRGMVHVQGSSLWSVAGSLLDEAERIDGDPEPTA